MTCKMGDKCVLQIFHDAVKDASSCEPGKWTQLGKLLFAQAREGLDKKFQKHYIYPLPS